MCPGSRRNYFELMYENNDREFDNERIEEV